MKPQRTHCKKGGAMSPDYTSPDGRIKLYRADCMDYMATLEDNAFELAVVDPPYGIDAAKKPISMGRFKRDIHKPKSWDNSAPNNDYFKSILRVNNNQIIWGGNYFIDYLESTRCFLVWDKNNGGNNMSDCELAWTSFCGGVRKFTRSHIDDHNAGIKRIHPTQKPVKLYDWIYTNYAKEGDRILDTHLGSGSSAIAAHYAGLEFVGIELDADYFNAAVRRFEKETAQGDMFGKAAK